MKSFLRLRAHPRRRPRRIARAFVGISVLAALAVPVAASPASADADGTVVVFDPPVVVVANHTVTQALHLQATDTNGAPFVGQVCYSWTVPQWLEPVWFSITTDANGRADIWVGAGSSPGQGHVTAYANRLGLPCGTLSPTDVPGYVQVIVAPVSPTPVSVYPSDDCVAATGKVWDGFAGDSTYVKLRAQVIDTDTTWVCLRVDGPSLSYGAKFIVDARAPTVNGTPFVDDSSSLCTTTPNNAVPGEHPMVNGTVGDPANLAYMVDAYSHNWGNVGTTGAWVCAGIGAFQKRVVVPSVEQQLPSVSVIPDPPGPHGPLPSIDVPRPSKTCALNGGQRVVDTTTADDTHVYLYTLANVSSGTVQVCARADGATTAGGVLTVRSSGALPSVTPGTDPAICPTLVAEQTNPSQAAFKISRTPTGAVPASVCVTVNGSTNTLTVGPGSGGDPVTWTPDPT